VTDGADARYRGVRGFLLIPALLQPAWSIVEHIGHAFEIGDNLRRGLEPVDQFAILIMLALLVALMVGWTFAIFLAFRHDRRFPAFYGLLVLAEILTALAMMGIVLLSPHSAIGSVLLFAVWQFLLGGIFVPYLRTSKRAQVTFGGT
jgi:hypothetical protein